MSRTLPLDSTERKNVPVFSGPVKYFPAALAGVARVCKAGNDKHNPGEPLHHARGKSMDHADCVMRHLMDISDIEAGFGRGPYPPTPDEIDTLLEEANQMTWRSMALNQLLHEKYGRAPLAPGARLPIPEPLVLAADAAMKDMEKIATDPVRPGHFAERRIYAPKLQKAATPVPIEKGKVRHQKRPENGLCECGDFRCNWPNASRRELPPESI